jgi:diguanylate cyclase (GGDEF)-like protein/PAS domain S-box-containing protein
MQMSSFGQDKPDSSSPLSMARRADAANLEQMSPEEISALLHDLSVYQAELESQNEQLRNIQSDLQAAKNRYYKLYRHIPVGYVTLDAAGIIRECNDPFLKLSGRDPRKVIGRTLAEFVGIADRKMFDMWVRSGKNLTSPLTVNFNHEENSTLFVSLIYSRFEEAGEEVTLVACTDVTALKTAEDRVRLASVVFETASEGTMVTDANQNIILINPAFTKITGFTSEDILGKTPKVLNSGKHPPEFYRHFWHELHTRRHWEGEIWNRRKTGEMYPEWLTVNVLNDHHGNPLYYVAVFRDETERKEAEALIRKQATHDALTGLPNRMLFMDRLEQSMRNMHRIEKLMSLMFLDLDGFKEVNDKMGHDAGDQLLKDVAGRLLLCVRETDTVARLGGDEFALILSGLESDESVNRITDTILKSVAEPFPLSGGSAYVSASIGIATYPGDAPSADKLIKCADQAMYAAKNGGKNRASHFTEDMQKAAQARHKTIADMRLADIEQSFVLYYQPVVDLRSGEVRKAEGLLRWQHPEEGLLLPDRFIELAEETGMIMRLGDRVFRQALSDLTRWRNYRPDLQVSINVSPVQFRDGDGRLNEWVSQMRASELPGGSMAIEITEGLLLDRSAQIEERLAAFRDAGVEVALDDFGTGYSSLSYLKKFDIEYLKIDKSFTGNLAPGSEDMALCEAIVVMAHKLGLKVIAEGVETEEQRSILGQIGCDYAQGYLFSRPVSSDVFESAFLMN